MEYYSSWLAVSRPLGRKSDFENLPIPKGLCPEAQGWEERATLGKKPRPTTPTGLRHAAHIVLKPKPRWGFCPSDPLLRGVRSSQPWALLRNPVGIQRKHDSSKTPHHHPLFRLIFRSLFR